MSKINIDELLKILPKLIRENDTVKGAIISALSGVMATHDDIVELIKIMKKQFESMDKRFESMDNRFEFIQNSMDKRFETLVEQMRRGFEEARKEREDMRISITSDSSEDVAYLERIILDILNDKLTRENIQKSKITRKDLVDQDGEVFFENFITYVNVLVQNGKTFLMEIGSTVDNEDVFYLIQKGKLYELQTDGKFDELILVCLEINRTYFEQAIKQGVRVIAGEIT